MFVACAIHHPHPDHVEDFLGHMRLVIETVRGAPGLLAFDALRDEGSGDLIGLSRWRTREDFEAALPLIAANVDRRQPEWTIGEDELLLLSPVDHR